jgi:hypothetical protein
MSALQAAYDDPEDPAELTLFPPDSDCRETCWLTVDVEAAVDLATMA